MSELSENRLEVLRAVNRICDEYESALGAAGSSPLREYLASLPEAVSDSAARHLVALDVDYRRLRGESPRVEDYAGIDSLDPRWLNTLFSTVCGSHDSPGSASRKGSTPPLSKGAELGDYIIGDLIGVGGMGAVYEATHVAMLRQVAIKVIGLQDASELEVERFRREARAVAKLSHPNVVRAYDAGEQDGLLYLAMELIDGENLEEWVARSGPLTIDESVEVVRQAALGLAHAHEKELVHRDVKPSNLVITGSNEVKVLDLGLARLAEPAMPSMSDELNSLPLSPGSRGTQSGHLLGTIDYVAPEQAIDPATASHAVDIYALGCTWAYLLTGEAYYGYLPTGQRLIAHQVGEVASLRGSRPDLPKRLDCLLQSMIAKLPEERPSSMLEVVKALDSHRAGQINGKLLRRAGGLSLLVLAIGVSAGLAITGFDLTATPPRKDATRSVPRHIGFAERANLQRQAADRTGLSLRREGAGETRLVLVPAGGFLMGTEKEVGAEELMANMEFPQHVVTISQPFYIAETETTYAQFRRFVAATGYRTQPEQKNGVAWGLKNGLWRRGPYSWKMLGDYEPQDDHPVTNLTWHDAVAYCQWLTAEAGGVESYRLPTEAEWEYACRAGSVFPWEFGDEESLLVDYGWYIENSRRTPRPVAAKSANAWGLFDMHGNVAEWCLDEFTETGRYYDSEPKTDPVGAEAGRLRVQRGGNCLSTASEVRSASRSHQWAENPTRGGFRVVLESH